MATNAELLDIGTLIQIRMDNNYPALITELSNMGYNVTVLTPQADVMRILINLYKTDPASVWRILQSVPFNAAANNYTTSETFKNRVTQVSGQTPPSSPIGKLSWDFLQGLYKPPTTITTVSPTVTTTPTGSTATTVGLVAIAVVIVVSAYYLFR